MNFSFWYNLFTPLVILLTSAAVYLILVRYKRLPPSGLKRALSWLSESIGLTFLFYVVNVLIGLLLIDAGQIVTRSFISHYLVQDPMLLAFSFMQAVVCRRWLEVK